MQLKVGEQQNNQEAQEPKARKKDVVVGVEEITNKMRRKKILV